VVVVSDDGCLPPGCGTCLLDAENLTSKLTVVQQGKAWMLQLLSVACISLAAKMEETEVPVLLDLQV
jgi:hypothetical protein